MGRPTDWHVLDLSSDPTPGEPGQVQVLARSADGVARDAQQAAQGVRSLAGDAAVTSWVGLAGDVFRGALDEFPVQLDKLRESYEQAADALSWWARHLDDVQSTADRALQQGREARAEIAALSAQLAAARAEVGRASAASASLRDVPSGAPPPDPDQVRRAVDGVLAAQERAAGLSGSLAAAEARLAAARRLAEQARELRRDGARTTRHRLHDASDAGIPPKSRWERFKEAAAKVWEVTVKVATVVAVVVAVVALFVGGPIVWGILLAASAVLLADALAKYARGEGSAWQVALAALGVIPGGRLLTALGRATGLARAGARLTPALAAAGTRLSAAATSLRAGAGQRLGALAGDAGHLTLGRRAVDGLPRLAPALQRYVDRATDLGLATRRDAANFYSGGRGPEHARHAAEQHAGRTGTTTLEQTPGGRWLDEQRLFDRSSPIDGEQAMEVWKRTSLRYAEEASGDVRAFVRDPNPRGVFMDIELPALQRGLETGRVTSIEIVDLAGGTRTVLRPGGIRETFPLGGGR